jgi:hypothetical protein
MKQLFWVCSLIVLVAFSRLVPHINNLTPVAALGLFGGAFLVPRLGVWLPLVALGLSDVALFWLNADYAFDGWFLAQRAFDAAALVVIYGFGYYLGRGKRTGLDYALPTAALGSGVFFVLSNFGVWCVSGMYPHTLVGLINCYVLGLPFYVGTLAGDLVYTGLFFGVAAVARFAPLHAPEALRA